LNAGAKIAVKAQTLIGYSDTKCKHFRASSQQPATRRKVFKKMPTIVYLIIPLVLVFERKRHLSVY
jgi:hypothetical protein